MDYPIDGSFSVEITRNLGDYNSIKSRASLTIGEVVQADSLEEARDLGLALLQKVTDDVKLHLAANAEGVSFVTDEHGVGQLGVVVVTSSEANGPLAEAVAQPAVAPTTPSETPSESASAAPSTSDGVFVPKSHGKDRFTIKWDGQVRTLFDNRESKTGNQPDFKLPKLEGEAEAPAFWIDNQDGTKNKAAYVLIQQIKEAVPA